MAGVTERFRKGLARTRVGLVDRILGIAPGTVDETFFEELESTLIEADLGVNTAIELTDAVRERAAREKIRNSEGVITLVKEKMEALLESTGGSLQFAKVGPTVILLVGVNGSGKTTSAAKLARRLHLEGRKVLIAAADTFRAAAIEQLEDWANAIGVQIIKHRENSDPAAVVFDALEASVSRGMDAVIVDTAGRLQNKKNLMQELEKIKRVAGRTVPGAPHEVLLVLDASTGQNAVSQAAAFNECLDVTGIVLTKLDGTAKGGIVVSIAKELQIPVKYVGLGEGPDDLEPFQPEEFVAALFDERGEGT